MPDFKNQIERLTEIGIALSAELRLDALLEKIVRYARELSQADAGTLYLLLDGALHFQILQNDSLKIYIVSDRQTNSDGKLFLELINDISGDTLWTNVSDVSLPDNSSAVYFADELTSILKNFNKEELFLSCRYIDSADLKTYSNKLIFVKPKNYKGTTL